MNFLEQLVAEWYGYSGHFILKNVKFGKLRGGGYEGEMDIVAFNPQKQILCHIEVSSDAVSWEKRKERFKKKFEAAARYYGTTFTVDFKSVERIAIVGWGSSRLREPIDFGKDISVFSIPKFIEKVSSGLSRISPMHGAVPEGYPLLRAIQFAGHFGFKIKSKKAPN